MNEQEQDEIRVARHLDGDLGPLTPAQQRLADQIAADQAWVGPLLDVSMPPETLWSAGGRLAQGAAATPGPASDVRMDRLAAAAVAAVLIVAVWVLPHPPSTPAGPAVAAMSPETAVEHYVSSTPMDEEFVALVDDLDDLETDLSSWPEVPLEEPDAPGDLDNDL